MKYSSFKSLVGRPGKDLSSHPYSEQKDGYHAVSRFLRLEKVAKVVLLALLGVGLKNNFT